MPVELLVSIAERGLPATISDSVSIDKLRVLRAAHLVVADIPSPESEGGAAIVHQITFEGRSLLERWKADKSIA